MKRGTPMNSAVASRGHWTPSSRRSPERLAPLGDEVEPLLRRARESMSGGKRLRAAFCYWGFHAVRPSPSPAEEESLVRAAAALELLQASALVHDDVIDDSDTRRGAPAAHRAFEADHSAAGWPGRSRAYGDAAAVLLGDLLLTWSDELLRTSGFGGSETSAPSRCSTTPAAR